MTAMTEAQTGAPTEAAVAAAPAAPSSSSPPAVANESVDECGKGGGGGGSLDIGIASNILAGKIVANAIRTSLGSSPDKENAAPPESTDTNAAGGHALLTKLRLHHPAAKRLVELSDRQREETGDDSASAVVIAGALLDAAGRLMKGGTEATIVAESFRAAVGRAAEIVEGTSKPVDLSDRDSMIELVAREMEREYGGSPSPELAASVAVDSATKTVRTFRDVTPAGGGLSESYPGILLDKGPAKLTAGPTSASNARVALLKFWLTSSPATKLSNASPAERDRMLKDDRKRMLQECKLVKKSGVGVALIGRRSAMEEDRGDEQMDVNMQICLHFLGKMGLMVVTDVDDADVEYVTSNLGCALASDPSDLTPDKIGTAGTVTEITVDGKKRVKFEGVGGDALTVILRGPTEESIEDLTRSIDNAENVLGRVGRKPALIAGGGAPEAEAALRLKERVYGLDDDESKCVRAYGDALEVIPYTLAENCGLDPVDSVVELRKRHADDDKDAGIDVEGGAVADMGRKDRLRLLAVPVNALTLATDTVCSMLKQ